MTHQFSNMDVIHEVFNRLVGTWIGKGQGFFPTIEEFEYRETLSFERQDEGSLFYNQRTEKRPLSQKDFTVSHWESGFLQVLQSGELELINTQSGGRSEVLVGSITSFSRKVTLTFASRLLSNDARMLATARTITVEHDTLIYEMGMHTTQVNELTPHLKATLYRVQ
ncbi:MAG: heme-binding beta-barrel domain-containing protein [Ardenticatenaceae bacterium]|nr:heme-binding beta-barrel domain-containing protein [Ardenticatenaceae bacterium]